MDGVGGSDEEKAPTCLNPVSVDDEALWTQTTRALKLAIRYASDLVRPDGHWCGELRTDVAITAQHIFFNQALGLDMAADADAYRTYIFSQQNSQGSWSVAPDMPGDVSISAEAYLALKILGVAKILPEMRRARSAILALGGLAKVRFITRMSLAQFGLISWDAVPQLLAEFVLLPSQFPVNIYTISSWARVTVVPTLIIRHHQPVYALPNGLSAKNDFLDELWVDAKNQNAPFSTALSDMWKNDVIGSVCGFLDKAIYYLGGLRYFPLRGYARRKCVSWILEHQDKDGGWGGIVPAMHVAVQALLLEGFKLDDLPISRGLETIGKFTWEDQDGKRMQPSNSPVWDTVLMIKSLCDADVDLNADILGSAVKWSVANQLVGPEGDWRVYRPSLISGGFAFEYENAWYPDVDTTAAAVLAFVMQSPQALGSDCVERAATWICGMQNKDGGWAGFDFENNQLFLNKIPFCDMKNLADPSSPDVTGRILEAFGLMIHISSQEDIAPDLLYLITGACDRGIAYIEKTQETDGYWYGRWACNYLFGTSNVLCGLKYFSKKKELHHLINPAITWLKLVQNADGGWGESFKTYNDPGLAGCGPSTPSQTAWAIMALLTRFSPDDEIIKKGIRYLIVSQTVVKEEGASWPEKAWTGTGFPRHFYLGYALYRLYFPLMALGQYMKAVKLSEEELNA